MLFAQEILGLGAQGFGILLSMGAVGGLAGSQAARRVSRRYGMGTALNFSIVGAAVTYIGIAVTSSVVVVGALLALSGFVAIVWNVLTVSLRQQVVESGMPDRAAPPGLTTAPGRVHRYDPPGGARAGSGPGAARR